MYQSRAYDDENGEPVVVLVTTGQHDVSRLVNLLQGRLALCEHIGVADQILDQVRRHNGGRQALALLKAHGGPDFTGEDQQAATGQHPGPGQADADRLPHEDYVTAVCERLSELGIEVADGITTTPDGEVLEAAISFGDGSCDADAWPDGVYLGWDQREGWSLCDEGENRTLYPLDLDVYANPKAVADRARARLLHFPGTEVDGDWDGAAALQDAVERWEVNSR